MESLMASPVVKSFLSGSLSGFTSTVMFQPFDLVKTRVQTSEMRAPQPCPTQTLGHTHPNPHVHAHGVHTDVKLPRPSIFGVVASVVREEKIRGLWKGVTPSIVRTVPGVGLYFSILHTMKSSIDVGQPNAIQSLVLGASSRTIAGVILLPFTVIKARFESGFFKYSGISNALITIYKMEGVRGLWSGMCATVLRDAPFSGIYLMFYNQAKMKALERRDSSFPWVPAPTVHFVSGLWAGALASAVTQPPDVVKTHMQLHSRTHKRVIPTVIFIYNYGGIRGFFRGLVPRTMRRTLMAATAWTVYEQLMTFVGLK